MLHAPNPITAVCDVVLSHVGQSEFIGTKIFSTAVFARRVARHTCKMQFRRNSENASVVLFSHALKRCGLFEIVEMTMPIFAPMTGDELQRARQAAAERFLAVAERHKPEGYTFEYRKSLSGMHYGKRKLIQAPRPTTRKALYIFLHECAHAHLGHSHNGKSPRHVEEMEAEKWAHEKMREAGVPVPRSMTQRAKAYVGRKIEQAEARGAKRIDPAARRYASA